MTAGTIVRAPAGPDDTVDVVFPDFDDEQIFTGLRWMPRGTDAPTVGADCLVHDAGDTAWVIAWWPTS